MCKTSLRSRLHVSNPLHLEAAGVVTSPYFCAPVTKKFLWDFRDLFNLNWCYLMLQNLNWLLLRRGCSIIEGVHSFMGCFSMRCKRMFLIWGCWYCDFSVSIHLYLIYNIVRLQVPRAVYLNLKSKFWYLIQKYSLATSLIKEGGKRGSDHFVFIFYSFLKWDINQEENSRTGYQMVSCFQFALYPK